MRRGHFHRLWSVLGLVAMFGAVVELPAAATAAVVKTMGAASAPTEGSGQVAGPESPKPCSHCPKKVGFDLSGCLVKCFQAFYAPVAKMVLLGVAVTLRLSPPARSRPAIGTTVPPPLRPPSA